MTSYRRPARRKFLMIAAGVLGISGHVSAASLTEKDVQVTARAMGFFDPAVQSGVVAVAYSAGNPVSHADADSVVALFGGGVTAGSATVTAKAVDAVSLGDGSGYVGIILAEGGNSAAVMAAAKARHIPCITGATDLVQSGGCVMSVKSDPKVDITVNHAAAAATGVSFTAAFRMLIHEI